MKAVLFLSALTLSAPLAAGSVREFRHTAADGIERPYVVYTPSKADGGKRPLLVFLHGAVESPAVRADPAAYVRRSSFLKLAEACGCYVLFPFGQKGATWFDDVGSGMVLAETERVLRELPIDEKRVFLSGFSDGASGTFYLAATRPERFAGFIALNGSLPVAAHLGALPVYPANFAARPLYVVNTRSDPLYPAADMQPVADFLRRHKINLSYRTPDGGHDMRYLDAELPALARFVERTRRRAIADADWESADPAVSSGSDWLHITRLGGTAQPWQQPPDLKLRHRKAVLGLRFDTGEGSLKVAEATAGGSAARSGVQAGDVVLALDGADMNDPTTRFFLLRQKRAGDPFTLTLRRGGDILQLSGRFNPPYDYQVFAKRPPSARVRAHFSGCRIAAETSAAAEIAVDFARLPPHRCRRIEVVLNGKRLPPVAPRGLQRFVLDKAA